MKSMVVFLIACLTGSSAWADGPKVVTDIPAIQSLAAMVMGDVRTPAVLVGGADDPHHFQMRPSQARSLADADILIWVGADLTPWLAASARSLATDAQSLELLGVSGTLQLTDDHGLDPHAWLAPENGFLWLEKIAEVLIAADPENAATYEINRTNAQAALGVTVTALKSQLAETGPHSIIAAHDAYGYFAHSFGIRIAGALSDTDNTAASAARVRSLQQIIANEPITCVVYEDGQDTGALDALIAGTGIQSASLNATGVGMNPGAGLYTELLGNIANQLANCSVQPN